jgi:transcription elongation factor Elf1
VVGYGALITGCESCGVELELGCNSVWFGLACYLKWMDWQHLWDIIVFVF